MLKTLERAQKLLSRYSSIIHDRTLIEDGITEWDSNAVKDQENAIFGMSLAAII